MAELGQILTLRWKRDTVTWVWGWVEEGHSHLGLGVGGRGTQSPGSGGGWMVTGAFPMGWGPCLIQPVLL